MAQWPQWREPTTPTTRHWCSRKLLSSSIATSSRPCNLQYRCNGKETNTNTHFTKNTSQGVSWTHCFQTTRSSFVFPDQRIGRSSKRHRQTLSRQYCWPNSLSPGQNATFPAHLLSLAKVLQPIRRMPFILQGRTDQTDQGLFPHSGSLKSWRESLYTQAKTIDTGQRHTNWKWTSSICRSPKSRNNLVSIKQWSTMKTWGKDLNFTVASKSSSHWEQVRGRPHFSAEAHLCSLCSHSQRDGTKRELGDQYNPLRGPMPWSSKTCQLPNFRRHGFSNIEIQPFGWSQTACRQTPPSTSNTVESQTQPSTNLTRPALPWPNSLRNSEGEARDSDRASTWSAEQHWKQRRKQNSL